MMRRTLLVLVGLAACAPAPVTPPQPDPAAALRPRIVAQFERAADDWNRGDLDAFLADYARDSLTSFVMRGHVAYGWDAIRANYAPRFAPGAERDSLRFEEFAVRPLGPSHALVTARFVLHRDGRTTASGPFTLVMARRGDEWKILHDHSSSD